MSVHDFRSQRLFVDAPLAADTRVECTKAQVNYLRNVLRLGNGARLLVFNGRDGEWEAAIAAEGRRDCALQIGSRTRAQEAGPDIHYLFAPLKRGRLDYLVQKATEMGVARLRPVLTRHTVADRVNLDRMRANVIEAAEQCGVLRIPVVDEPATLDALLAGWPADRALVFADEAAEISSPLDALAGLQPSAPCAVVVGPEGGFSQQERQMLRAHPATIAVSLGPRIMRADTAAVAVLALINAVAGDWR